jgi:GGDEF domain-containing protein
MSFLIHHACGSQAGKSEIDPHESASIHIIHIVSQPYSIEERTVCVTVSVGIGIGIGIYPMHGEDMETLIKNADKSLYEAKRRGGNDYRITTRIESHAIARSSGIRAS